MISLISTDVIAIIALCFTISFAKRNVVVCNKKKYDLYSSSSDYDYFVNSRNNDYFNGTFK